MTKIDIFSGFLGAGKTTLIKKLIKEAYNGEKLVLIENEFGNIGIDGEFMKDSGIMVNELNSGCICCSLVGDFSEALVKVLEEYSPDRIIIEPSGVGKLSDVIRAVNNVDADISLNGTATVVDVNKCKMYMKNFGEFFNDQIENAGCIVLSHTDSEKSLKYQEVINMIKEKNNNATIVITPWDELDAKKILEAIEGKDTLKGEMESIHKEHIHHHHHHDEECCCHHEHEHHHDEECCCHHEHEHHHDEECCCHHDHDHHHDEECCCHHEHEHHHHDEECCCHHEHEHHHHADDIFTSWGIETVKKFTKQEILDKLNALSDIDKYGVILRAKGIVDSFDAEWIHFDYVPNEPDVRFGTNAVCGRICVIGADINEDAIKELFL